MNYYEKKKNAIRQRAVEWQITEGLSWWEVAQWQDWFYLQARKYGLVREFRENGII